MTEQSETPVKTIPANIDAERAVLGSLLLDPDAMIKIANFVRPEDFFRERHSWIYTAMQALSERREPLDFVTLVDELERNELLEEVGGPAYITDLVNSTPSAIYVDHYARIVERTAVLRRLISAAGTIAEMAYDESADLDTIVDKSEQLIFGVSESRIHRDLTPIRAVMGEVVDRIDFLSQNRDTLMGVPTGFSFLDQMLGGFQKSDLIILAGRPGMGKTSFVLSTAQNAARHFDARVAVFSLEMSNEQLVQRLLSMETAIDSHRLRMGDVYEDEWPILLEAANQLSATSIFIDDTPAAGVNEIRTKARRLYSEHGLDMILIDYMQLMTGQSGRNENRQQEISYISRSLKGLARELNVPVIALSQLSRAVESRSDKRPMLSDLRESGCLTGDTLIYRPDLGTYTPIRELAGRSGFQVLALDRQTWKLTPATVSHAFSTGVKQTFRLTTRLGRTIRATANHPFLTINGWTRLDQLGEGEHIALPRTLCGPDQATLSVDEVALLGHLIGDGCTLPRHAIQYTTREQDLAELVHELTINIFGDRVSPRIVPERNWYQVYLSATEQLSRSRRNPIAEWLDQQSHIGMQYCGTTLYQNHLGRDRAAAVAAATGSEEMNRLSTSDVYWDQIVSIEPDRQEAVYDLTVPSLHNFVADNFIVHNSIEQDADVVLFIYREDYYIPDTDRQNIADVIVAKHRHGSTGTVSLFFKKELTQFRDLEIQRTELDY